MLASPKDVIPAWQGAASAALISLGMRFPRPVMDNLLEKFPPGVVPHFFVIQTLGEFVLANSVECVPMLKDVLSRVLPVLSSIKHDNIKWAFANALCNFCEGILHYVANIDKASDKSFTCESFSSEIQPCYEILFTHWCTDREGKVRRAAVKAIGVMCAVVS